MAQTGARAIGESAPAWLRVIAALALGAGLLLCAAAWPFAPAARVSDATSRRLRDGRRFTDDKVRVELYGEAGCPFTRGFLLGPVEEMLTVATEIVDFRLHAFGNAYFVTSECGGSTEGMTFNHNPGYSSTVRACWDELCGSNASEPAEDCFSGAAVYQHGTLEGLGSTAWACAVSKTDGEASLYMPFVTCTSKHYLSIYSEDAFRDVVHFCAEEAGLPAEPMLGCALGEKGRALLIQQARRTPVHPGVPYPVIDGEPLEQTDCVTCGNGLLPEVCKAWARKSPSSEHEPPVCADILR